MDQKIINGGFINYGDWFVEIIICHYKVFRLHAVLNDVGGAVRSHSGKGRGYSYMIGQGPKSCLLGQLTEVFFCLFLKHFMSSIFNSVDFESSMFRTVLDFEIADKTNIMELEVFIHGKIRGCSLRPP